MNTWWVDYTFEYEYYDSEDGTWEHCCDFDSGRFHCIKKEIKKNVRNYIETYELQGEQYRNLVVTINDQYITTDCEI